MAHNQDRPPTPEHEVITHEVHPTHAGAATQTREGRIANQDSHVLEFDFERAAAVIAVADGYGVDGHLASRAACSSVKEAYAHDGTNVDIAHLFDGMSQQVVGAVADTTRSGATGIVGVLDGNWLRWGAVGDSLGWIVRKKNGEVVALNHEDTVRRQQLELRKLPSNDTSFDGDGATLTHSLGGSFILANLQQGMEEVEEGDIIVFVSDGVSGDSEDQRMRGGNEEALRTIMTSNMTATEKAKALLEAATKIDDRTDAVVVVPPHTRRERPTHPMPQAPTTKVVGAAAVERWRGEGFYDEESPEEIREAAVRSLGVFKRRTAALTSMKLEGDTQGEVPGEEEREAVSLDRMRGDLVPALIQGMDLVRTVSGLPITEDARQTFYDNLDGMRTRLAEELISTAAQPEQAAPDATVLEQFEQSARRLIEAINQLSDGTQPDTQALIRLGKQLASNISDALAQQMESNGNRT